MLWVDVPFRGTLYMKDSLRPKNIVASGQFFFAFKQHQ